MEDKKKDLIPAFYSCISIFKGVKIFIESDEDERYLDEIDELNLVLEILSRANRKALFNDRLASAELLIIYFIKATLLADNEADIIPESFIGMEMFIKMNTRDARIEEILLDALHFIFSIRGEISYVSEEAAR